MGMLPILLLLMIHPFVSAFPFYGSEVQRASTIALVPSPSSTQHPTERLGHKFILHHQRLHGRKKVSAPTYFLHPPNYSPQGPSPSPTTNWVSAAPGPLPRVPAKQLRKPVLHPAISPVGSSLQYNNLSPPPPPPIFSLPLPPRNEDCASVTCAEPLTYTPSDSPCGCVAPLHIRLIFDVALYTFFPLVSELANEIATAFSLFPRQVRIMGANAASQQPQKTVVLINLVPFKLYFDSSTAFSVYYKFWRKQVLIMTPLFGAYEVLSVSYPGLPESPPSVSSTIYDGPYPGHGKDGMPKKPFGVDVPKQKRDGIGGRKIAIIALVSTIAFIACMGFVLLLLLKSGTFIHRSENLPNESIPMPRKPSEEATGSTIVENKTSSTSMFLSYSMQTYTGSAKTFSAQDIESATEKFDNSRILGEGGFGLVYSGTLDDGRKVAVKVLKRDDKQGSREFLAEVEMLSRLHHRNLVKLIGICVEDHTRCLVYELVPNGSVESHLHGVDEAESLDWAARMKIALGAARGLAYLHEDSSPCVIHRDFKSSNILLEPDFTPKVSDFGLARTAMDEGNKHISTHVMGTFGYLAPEYAMTGHLLVKSDVYSYGVVLLELLSGRKPVDFSQPPGQENLVSFARPLLTSKEGLKMLVDPTISSNTAFDSIAKVAAIASMCVQPEVSHRPFMGEVVQALKLVCSEFDETKEGEGSRNCTKEHFYMEIDSCLDAEKIRGNEGWESFGRSFRSGPLETEGRKQFWEKELSRGSVSEHSFAFTLPQGSH